MPNQTNDGEPLENPTSGLSESAPDDSENPPGPTGPNPGDFALDLSGDLLSEALEAVEKRLYSKSPDPIGEEIEIEIETPEAETSQDGNRPSSVEMKLVERVEALQQELAETKSKVRNVQDEQKLAQMKAKREGNSIETIKLELQDARDNASSNEQLASELRATLKEVNEETRRIKKRQEREVTEVRQKTADRICSELLPILDNLDRATKHVPDGFEDDQFVQGLLMTLGQLENALNQAGMKRISTQVGDKFDPQRHEAIARVSNSELSPGCIVEILQEGFSLNGRLLRAARVSVNTAEEPPDQTQREE